MKKGNNLTLMFVMILLCVLVIFFTLGIEFKLGVILFALVVVVLGVSFYFAYSQEKAIEEGFPVEDEMSTLLRYKAGFHSFQISLGVWFLLFSFRDMFSKDEMLFASGFLFPLLISFIVRLVVKRRING